MANYRIQFNRYLKKYRVFADGLDEWDSTECTMHNFDTIEEAQKKLAEVAKDEEDRLANDNWVDIEKG